MVAPVTSPTQVVLQTTDSVLSWGGLAAGVVPIAAMMFPVSAAVVAGSYVVAACSGAYSTVGSASHLSDRSVHEQSISITDRSARGSWLGVMGGTVAFAASDATQFLSSAARAGGATMFEENVVNGMNITSVIVSGSGLANGVCEIIGDEDISTLDMVQLGASKMYVLFLDLREFF